MLKLLLESQHWQAIVPNPFLFLFLPIACLPKWAPIVLLSESSAQLRGGKIREVFLAYQKTTLPNGSWHGKLKFWNLNIMISIPSDFQVLMFIFFLFVFFSHSRVFVFSGNGGGFFFMCSRPLEGMFSERIDPQHGRIICTKTFDQFLGLRFLWFQDIFFEQNLGVSQHLGQRQTQVPKKNLDLSCHNSYQKMARETCRNSPHNHLPKHKEEYRVNSSQPAAQSGGHVQTLIPPMNLTFTTTPQCFFIASLLIAFKHQKNGRHSELGSHIVSSRLSSTCKHVNELWTMGKNQNYFTSSDPHHDMLGGGCQVRVVIENMMGRMENLRTLISGFLGLVILVRWALVTMFLSWTTQTGCRVHRTYVSLIGSGEGRHTTHLLKCVPLLSTSQTDWKQSSDVLSDISFDILSDISSDKFFWHIFWHSFWHIFWHSFWHLSDISFDILSDKSFDTLSDISSDISFHMLSDISSDILSDISKPKPNIHSFTQKAALQTLYLPHTTQHK